MTPQLEKFTETLLRHLWKTAEDSELATKAIDVIREQAEALEKYASRKFWKLPINVSDGNPRPEAYVVEEIYAESAINNVNKILESI